MVLVVVVFILVIAAVVFGRKIKNATNARFFELCNFRSDTDFVRTATKVPK
jgi:uncharacterized protein HemY